jgi:hypothetical protein
MEVNMKKSLLIATALAVSSVAGSATALDIGRSRDLKVEGISASLGVLAFTPLGVNGQFCDYLADWASPFNPNEVGVCVLQELRTPVTPSCISNERLDIVTVVQSSYNCTGFNLKGEPYANVSLVLSESDCKLAGVAVIPGGSNPQIYPVTAS